MFGELICVLTVRTGVGNGKQCSDSSPKLTHFQPSLCCPRSDSLHHTLRRFQAPQILVSGLGCLRTVILPARTNSGLDKLLSLDRRLTHPCFVPI